MEDFDDASEKLEKIIKNSVKSPNFSIEILVLVIFQDVPGISCIFKKT